MNYSSLESYYRTIWGMVHHHKWSISDIENLIPFERDLYVDMTSDYLKKQEEAMKNG